MSDRHVGVRRPDIFISATSADLRSCRLLVKEALLTLGCMPVEQTNFPPDYRTVRAMLRARIATCDAVIHVAGIVYGAEPSVRDTTQPRRSYTQMEYDLALELHKPLYVFLCGDGFAYDEHPAEDPEKQALQLAHREKLRASETVRTNVHSREDLAQRIRELQTKVEQLSHELARANSWLRRGVIIGVLVLAVLGGTVWTLRQYTRESAAQTGELRDEVRMLKAVIARFNSLAPGAETISDDDRFDRALASVAAEYKVEVPVLKAKIDAFVAAVRANSTEADFYDRALADFAEKRFGAAATNAAAAAKIFRGEREAAERELTASAGRAAAARQRERSALTLGGDAQLAAHDYVAAQASFDGAAALASRTEESADWAALQIRLANCHWELATRVAGDAIARHLRDGLQAARGALAVYTREQHPTEWALAQTTLGNVLRNHARALTGAARATFLDQAAAAYHSALEVLAPDTSRTEWLLTQINLGNVFYDQAAVLAGPEHGEKLREAAARFRQALKFASPWATPAEWGKLQNNLGNTVWRQSSTSLGPERNDLLLQATAAFREALAVRPRATLPDDWALIQSNLANVFLARAAFATGAPRAELLAEGIAAHRSALEVFTLEHAAQGWALANANLGYALYQQSLSSPVEPRRALLAEAKGALEKSLQIHTQRELPGLWAMSMLFLGMVQCTQAETAPEAERDALYAAGVTRLEAAKVVYTRAAFPLEWARIHAMVAFALCARADKRTGDERAAMIAQAGASSAEARAIFARESFPIEWAAVQLTSAIVHNAQSETAAPPERTTLAAQAVAEVRAALEVSTRRDQPIPWAVTTRMLGTALLTLASSHADAGERRRTLEEAATALRTALEVLSESDTPDDFARARTDLAKIETMLQAP